jgi:hypothetical protein
MKRLGFILILVLMVFSLVGCLIKKPPENVKISASGTYDMNSMRLFGESNLQNGSILNLEIKEVAQDKEVYSEVLKVNNKGGLSWTDVNPDPTKEYSINLTFDPNKQSKEIQKKYGKNGENIKIDKLSGTMSKNGEVIIQKSTKLQKLGHYTVGGSFLLSSNRNE